MRCDAGEYSSSGLRQYLYESTVVALQRIYSKIRGYIIRDHPMDGYNSTLPCRATIVHGGQSYVYFPVGYSYYRGPDYYSDPKQTDRHFQQIGKSSVQSAPPKERFSLGMHSFVCCNEIE